MILINKLLKLLSLTCITLVIAILSFIIFYITLNGCNTVSLDFIFSSPRGVPFGSSGGIFPAIIGSLITAIASTIISSIFAISTAIVLVFYIKNDKLNTFIKTSIHCLSGIPSILIGLFGYSFFVITLGFGKSILSSTLALSIMIFPFIEIHIEKTINEFNNNLTIASYSLGLSKEYTILRLVLKCTKRQILSSITIATSFAMGATAPIMLTGAVINAPIPKTFTDPFMSLPYHLYILLQNGINKTQAFGTAFILISIIFLINFLGLLIGGNNE